MQVGSASPSWAQNLLYKWVEHDDPYFGCMIKAFIWYTDSFVREDRPEFSVRIFFDEEQSVRDEIAGKSPGGLAASFIVEGKYQVINTPDGLEQWTANKIADRYKE